LQLSVKLAGKDHKKKKTVTNYASVLKILLN